MLNLALTILKIPGHTHLVSLQQESTFKRVIANVSGVSVNDVTISSVAEIDPVADINVSVVSMGKMSGGSRRLLQSTNSASRVIFDCCLSVCHNPPLFNQLVQIMIETLTNMTSQVRAIIVLSEVLARQFSEIITMHALKDALIKAGQPDIFLVFPWITTHGHVCSLCCHSRPSGTRLSTG